MAGHGPGLAIAGVQATIATDVAAGHTLRRNFSTTLTMDPIDSVSRAMQLLRLRLAGGKTGVNAPRAAGAASAAGGLAPGPLRSTIAARLRALQPEDEAFQERAVEVFVEGVLLSEFGAGMTNDAQFRQLIHGVACAMRAEPQTAAELDQLIQALRQE